MATFVGSRNLAFVIRSSKIQGKGAFATRRIKKGERIIEYLGECIDADECDVRYPDDEMGRHHTFLFSIGDGSRVLDAGPLEWPAKYVNHSCDPNCEAIEEEDGRVFVHALKTLEKGQELLYDYAYERTPEHTAEDEILYKCLCGSPKCRGSILAPPKPVKAKKNKKGKGTKDKQAKQDKKQNKQKKQQKASDGSTSNAERAAPEVVATQASGARTPKIEKPVVTAKVPATRKKKAGTKVGTRRVSKDARTSVGTTAGVRKGAGGTKRPGKKTAR